MKRITAPVSKITLPLMTSKLVNAGFSSLIHFMFIPIKDVEKRNTAPNMDADRTIAFGVRASGTTWWCFHFASDALAIASDNTLAVLIPKSLRKASLLCAAELILSTAMPLKTSHWKLVVSCNTVPIVGFVLEEEFTWRTKLKWRAKMEQS